MFLILELYVQVARQARVAMSYLAMMVHVRQEQRHIIQLQELALQAILALLRHVRYAPKVIIALIR